MRFLALLAAASLSALGAGDVRHYRVEGAGHVWPSTRPNLDSATPTYLDATPVIWQFFQQNRLRG